MKREAQRSQLTYSKSNSKRERETEFEHTHASVQNQAVNNVPWTLMGYHPDPQASIMLFLALRSLVGREMAAGRHLCYTASWR